MELAEAISVDGKYSYRNFLKEEDWSLRRPFEEIRDSIRSGVFDLDNEEFESLIVWIEYRSERKHSDYLVNAIEEDKLLLGLEEFYEFETKSSADGFIGLIGDFAGDIWWGRKSKGIVLEECLDFIIAYCGELSLLLERDYFDEQRIIETTTLIESVKQGPNHNQYNLAMAKINEKMDYHLETIRISGIIKKHQNLEAWNEEFLNNTQLTKAEDRVNEWLRKTLFYWDAISVKESLADYNGCVYLYYSY